MHALHSSSQEAASSTLNGAPAITEPETVLSPPGTLALNSEFRSSNLQQDRLVKGLNYGEGGLRIHAVFSSSIHTGEEELSTDSSLKLSSENREAGDLHDCALSEDEYVCPIYLEGNLFLFIYDPVA